MMYNEEYENEHNTPDTVEMDQEKKAKQEKEANAVQGSTQAANQNSTNADAYEKAQPTSYGNAQQNMYGSYHQPNGADNGNSGRYGQPYGGSNGSYGSYGQVNGGNNGNFGNYGQPGSGNSGNFGNYGQPNGGNFGNFGSGRQQNNSSYGHYAPWQQPQQGASFETKKVRPKKPVPPLLKKTAGVVAAAFLFGIVAGGTISGIGLLTDYYFASEKQEQVTLSQAETLPVPQANSGESSATAIVTGTNDVSAIVEHAMPSVVAINSVTQHEIQNWFGQSQIYEGKGSGSGIIVGESDTELLIVTNNHVVEGASSLSVSFSDNESAEAHIKGTDSENDLAVLAVSLDTISDDTKSKIAIATLGNSDTLKVGQGVIAIGNALGYGQSVTVGYISALDREVHTDEQTTRNLLQTDAAINPGNSGGALLNMQGEVIGINSAKYSSTDVEGMGYAIPISKVSSIIDDLMTKKTRVQIEQERQGYLGIQGTDIDSNTANLYGMPQGVFVYKIMEDGAAASSDLKEKDIITKFDGQTVRTMSELKNMLIYYAGGDSVELTVQSLQDGQYVERQVTITLGIRPKGEQVN